VESIAAPLHLVTFLLKAIETSQSLENTIRNYLQTENTDICVQLKEFYTKWQARELKDLEFIPSKLHYRRALFEVLLMGLKGRTIYPMLKSLEEEIVIACEQEIHSQAAKLPFLLLMPLLLLQTPAFLLLLFGPILQQLQEAF
jgi:hypothetical protein